MTGLVNAFTGYITKNYQYDAFGNEKSPSGSDMNPFRYCGEYWDSETGTYYLRARYYDPKLGRFLTADTHWNVANMIYGDDPVEINGKNVPNRNAYMQSLNLYAYCMSNPIMFIDPTGEAAINVIFAAIGAIAGWVFGDYVANQLGVTGWEYWVVRAGVTIGGAVIGWFAGAAISKVAASFLKANPTVVFKLANTMGAGAFISAMKFLGINPFTLATKSNFAGLLNKVFNSNPSIQIGLDWAKTLIQKAQQWGYSIRLDPPHDNNWNIWHLNIGNNHVAIDQSIVEAIKKILGIE